MTETSATQEQKAAAERQGAELVSNAAVSALGLFQSDGLIIDRPPPGVTKVIDVASSRNLKFNFSLDDCKVTILDVDVVLMFPDGGKLLMPALVMQIITAQPPQMRFGDLVIEPQSVIAAAGDVRLVDPLPQLAISDNAKAINNLQENAPQTPTVVQLPAAQNFANIPGPLQRPPQTESGLEGGALEAGGRFNKRATLEEQQSSGSKSEGAITSSTEKTAIVSSSNQTRATQDLTVKTENKDRIDSTPPVVENNSTPGITSSGGADSANITTIENFSEILEVTAADADTGQNIIYSIAGGLDANLFSINSVNGKLYFINNADFETPKSSSGSNEYNIIIQASDGKAIDQQSLNIRVLNVNESPTGGILAGSVIAENAAINTIIGKVIGADADAASVLNYTFAPGGAAGGRFAIDAVNGDISVNNGTLLDYESSDTQVVVVRITDQFGLTLDKSFIINILDANDAPIIISNGGGTNATTSLPEGILTVTTVTATDADAGASQTYSIVGGDDALKFSINAATGVLTFIAAPDFEGPTDVGANNVYDVIVQVTDGSLTDIQTVAVTVLDVNDPPVIASDGGAATAAITLAENGTAATTVTATDANAGATQTYSIVGGADALKFSINAATGVLTVITAPDFENPTDVGGNNVYDVIVQVTDGLLTDTQAIAVTVTNVNESAPDIASNGGAATAAISVAENSTAATTLTATDADAGATQTYSIVGGADALKFSINATTGVLTFIAAPDFEAPTDAGGDNVYDVTAQVSDGALIDVQAIAVTVTNLNEAPVILLLSNNSLNENSGGNTVIGTVFASDPEGSFVTFRLTDDAGGAFRIRETTGELMVWDSRFFDYEDKQSHQVTVEARDASGNASTATYTINVNNLADGANTLVFQVVTSGDDTSVGGSTNDIYLGSAGNDTIFGNAGNDLFGSGDGNDTYNGGNGNDKFNVSMHQGVDTIVGGAGSDVLYIEDSGYDSTLNLAASGSIVTGTNSAAQSVFTATEVERLEYWANSSGGTLNVGAGMSSAGISQILFYGERGDDVVSAAASDVFMYIRSDSGNDTIITGSGNDDIGGGNGNNTINSGAGNDVIDTGSGADFVVAGSGDDNVDTFDGNDTIYGGDGNDDLDGGAGDDLITGDEGDDDLYGGIGNDTINGGNGNDEIYVGIAEGNDTINGGSGYDVAYIAHDGTFSTVNLTASGGIVTATNASVQTILTTTGVEQIQFRSSALGGIYYVGGGMAAAGIAWTVFLGGSGYDVVSAAGNDARLYIDGGGGGLMATGGTGDDFISSGNNSENGDDIINGGAGDDFLDGQDGNNAIDGGDGNDTIYGGSGNDSILGGAGNDIIYSELGNDTIDGGAGDDMIYAADGDDIITGGPGNDTIYGGAGNDIITVGSGANTIFGENGADIFIVDIASIFLPATNIDGGSGFDTLNVTGSGTLTGADLAASVTSIQALNFEAAGVVGNLANFTAVQLDAIVGGGAPGKTLDLYMDANDTFTVAAGQYYTQAGNDYTFYYDAAHLNELARVSIL